MSRTESWEPRTAADVPWNDDRERRVLGGALRSWRRRARRRRALEISAFIVATLLAGKIALRAIQVDHALAAPSDRIAGTGGQGGAAAQGHGGSAGTG